MRRIIDWLSDSISHRAQRATSASAATCRRATSLRLEPLECRDLLTVSVTPVYTVTNNWGSGFQADLRLDSHQAAAIAPWKLDFDLPANITSIWNATISAHSGNHYTIVGANWNSSLAGGGSVSFGFVAGGNGASARPANYSLNGNALGTSTPPPLPSISIGNANVTEGNSGTTSAVLTATLSAPAASAVSVVYATSDGTAQAASDYRAASGTLTFAPGETAKTLSVAIVGDTQEESDETFFVDLSNPAGATLAQQRGTLTIKNDDAPPQSANFQFQVSSDWGSGFTAQVTVRNPSPTPVNNWKLDFDFAGNITAIWDATVVSHVGNHYVVQNAGYNSTIGAGGTASFGFNGSPGNVKIGPTNYVLGSVGSASGNPGGTNHSPLAADDAANTLPGEAIVINPLANDSDVDSDALAVTSITAAAHGAAVLNPDSTVRYTPQAGYTGTDTFTYQVRDARGATATGRVNVTVAVPSAWPAHVFAPYVDMTLYPMYDLMSAARTSGLRYFSLAFIVADPQNRPAWGGYSQYILGSDFDTQMRAQIAGVRALGGDVVISFGGAANSELAEVISDVPTLQRAYQQVIDAYGLTHIDFDIEGAAIADRAAIDRRNQAIAGLEREAAAAGRPLEVSYTLPVLPSGLTADGLYVLQSAARAGASIGLVNVMAMDYGDSAAPNPQGKMGDYAIIAANSTFTQLKTIYGAAKTDAQLWQMVGVTPMIGLNDVVSETFDQQEARELLAFAQQKGIGRLAFWSLNRDQQNASGKINWVENTSSSLVQQPLEFSKIFNAITG